MKTILILLMAATCYGADWNQSLADAIYKAEGGAKTKHPYGILQNFTHTTPRRACLNTIRHAQRRWVEAGRPNDFITYLGASYCPVGAANDPTGINRHWVKNVKAFMKQANQPLNPL